MKPKPIEFEPEDRPSRYLGACTSWVVSQKDKERIEAGIRGAEQAIDELQYDLETADERGDSQNTQNCMRMTIGNLKKFLGVE